MQEKFDKIQKDKYIIEYWCAGSLLGNNDDLNVYGINNDGSLKDLNDKLIENQNFDCEFSGSTCVSVIYDTSRKACNLS